MRNLVTACVKRARGIGGRILHKITRRYDIQYWNERVRIHGRRSVLNMAHPLEEYDSVTHWQKNEIFSRLKPFLDGTERVVLDFGCGPGRFSASLADLTGGKVIAMDPVAELLTLAPVDPRVEYRNSAPGKIPLPAVSVDLVWVCLVLGGIRAGVLRRSIAELQRVLKPGGLMCLVENTADQKDAANWAFRGVPWHQARFRSVALQHVADYYDVGDRISIMAGRKLGSKQTARLSTRNAAP